MSFSERNNIYSTSLLLFYFSIPWPFIVLVHLWCISSCILILRVISVAYGFQFAFHICEFFIGESENQQILKTFTVPLTAIFSYTISWQLITLKNNHLEYLKCLPSLSSNQPARSYYRLEPQLCYFRSRHFLHSRFPFLHLFSPFFQLVCLLWR